MLILILAVVLAGLVFPWEVITHIRHFNDYQINGVLGVVLLLQVVGMINLYQNWVGIEYSLLLFAVLCLIRMRTINKQIKESK